MKVRLSPQQQTFNANWTSDLVSQKFDLAIWLLLNSWPAMQFAVQNDLGGTPPLSAEKRDWLAGVISELFASRSDTDQADVEDLLLQVMGDEFEINIEDGTETILAREILRMRAATLAGRFDEIDQLHHRWEQSKRGQDKIKYQIQEEDQDTSASEDGENEENDGGLDINMDDAPPLVPAAKKEAPEVDEDGFTKVVSKKRR